MRFVLVALLGEDKAVLKTRVTNKRFTTKVSDLIFIESDYNKKKAARIMDADIKIPNWVNDLK